MNRTAMSRPVALMTSGLLAIGFFILNAATVRGADDANAAQHSATPVAGDAKSEARRMRTRLRTRTTRRCSINWM